MTPKKSGIAASAIGGVRWNYIGSVFSTIASFTIGAVLARILGGCIIRRFSRPKAATPVEV